MRQIFSPQNHYDKANVNAVPFIQSQCYYSEFKANVNTFPFILESHKMQYS